MFAKEEDEWIGSGAAAREWSTLSQGLGWGTSPGEPSGDLCGSLGYGDICFVFDCAVRFVGILVPQPGIEPPDPWP